MDRIVFTLITAGLGGFAGIKLRLPAGALIGSMFSAAAYNISTGNGYIPISFKLIAQIIVGGIIGLNFDAAAVKSLKKLAAPAAILASGLLIFNLLLGYAISSLTDLDLTTALFCCAPGGVADMTLISEAYGADTPKVVMLHLVRLISVILVFPLIITRFAGKIDKPV